MAKTEYWWVSVGGNPCEPAILTNETKKIYTFGCPDALDAEGGHVELVKKIDFIPDTPAESARKQAAWERKSALEEKRGIVHGYRRF